MVTTSPTIFCESDSGDIWAVHFPIRKRLNGKIWLPIVNSGVAYRYTSIKKSYLTQFFFYQERSIRFKCKVFEVQEQEAEMHD